MTSLAAPPRSVPVRVLLADDATDLRFLLQASLEAEGDFTVVAEAEDGVQAAALAIEHQPDLVLLDLAMPRMDGLQALEEIVRSCPNTVVVVVSGFEAGAVGGEVQRLGALDYIQKGTPVAELVARVRRAIGLPPGRERGPASPQRSAAEDFAAAAAHELQNPVAAIAGFAELLEESWDRFDDDRRREMSTRIHRQARRLQRLISALLTATRAEHGGLDLHRTSFSVRDAVLLAMEGIEKAETISVEVPPEVRAVGDLHATAQIVTNLASNALRHGAPPVEIDATTSGAKVQLRVCDRGQGVAPDRQREIFDKFVRGRQGGGGVGLGLYIAKQLALAQEGELDYEHEIDPTFVLTLPADG